MENLYKIIQDTRGKYKIAHAKYLELRSKMAPYGYEPDEKMYEKYTDAIKRIEKIYKINYKRLARIISKEKGKEYRFMVFREVDIASSGSYITYDYIAAFINKDCKYFNATYKEGEGLLLCKEDYRELLNELTDDNSSIVSRGDNIDYRDSNPCRRLEKINYIQLCTRCDGNDISLVRPEFKEQIKPMLKTRLEKLEVSKEEKSLFGV